MRVLDLFCGAMGAAEGYRRAGLDVTGVDVRRRQHLPDGIEFVKADALDVLADVEFVRSFDLVHASPPCQTHTRAKHLRDAQGHSTSKLNLLPETREGLRRAGVPYVIENVVGAPLRHDLVLCGSMFPELHVIDDVGRRWLRRHRVFEIAGWVPSHLPVCCTCVAGCSKRSCLHRQAGVRALGVYAAKGDDIPSGGQTCRSVEQGRALMGMPWASWAGLVEAIPPAYTEWIGARMSRAL